MQRTLLYSMCFAILIGCDAPAPAPTNATPGTAAPAPPPGAAQIKQEAQEAPQEVTPDESEDFERQVAEVGVGKSGRNYGGGVISEPIKQYFQVGDRMQLLNMTHAMNLYKAEHGRLPQTHDEFMDKIIKANSIALPELPEGERYVYDPQRGELMVERPK